MTVTLLLSRPTFLMVFAVVLGALPWSRVGFFVLGEITRSLEVLTTVSASTPFLLANIALALASHGANGLLVNEMVFSSVGPDRIPAGVD